MAKICPCADYCGGCQYQGLAYDKQLIRKQQYVEGLLSSFGKVEKIIGMKDPYSYRNKVQFSFGYDDDHQPIAGFYLPSSHLIVPIEECLIADELINRIYASFKKLLRKYRIPFYDERSRKGFLRHILIRTNKNNEAMVVLVVSRPVFPQKDAFIRELSSFNPQIRSIILNINSKPTSRVLGEKDILLYGKDHLFDELCGRRFKISAQSFYQVNKTQTEVLYNTALDLADLQENEVVLDAYCGIGTLGLAAAKRVRKVIGVELNAQAIRDAETNMQINKISNAEFIAADAGKYLEECKRKNYHIDTIIMDPPRAGSDKRFLSSLIRIGPEKIIYISCNPHSLKNDLQYLQKYYQIKKIIPVDMFPFTSHIESVVKLTRARL